MKLVLRRLAPLAAVALAACAGAQPNPGAARAALTVIVIRHAERAADGGADPGLSPDGLARAAALPEAVRAFGAPPLRAIFTTQYVRTRETARPLSERTRVPITVRPITPENAASYAAEVARAVLALPPGGTVVVVGHSNTVPGIVAALSGGPAPVLGDDQYGDLFRVIVSDGGTPRVDHLRYGRAVGG